MKYRYNKKALRTLSVGPFLAIDKTRNSKINEAPDDMPVSEFNANRLATALHPKAQYAKVEKVIDHRDAKSFVLVPDPTRNTSSLAYFRAGQYVSVSLQIGSARLAKPYSIRSNPGEALGTEHTSYTITVKKNATGYASEYILNNWIKGSEAELSGPLGGFYYERLRDAKTVIGLAGGSGITPFYSMASAIAEGIEDFNLTILYGSRTKDSILLYDELDDIVSKSNGKVKIIHVLSEEKADGFEHGFLSAEIIQRYAPSGDYSVFMCGPRAMYEFVDGELAKLNLKRRRIRRELYGEFGDPAKDAAYPGTAASKSYQLRVEIFGEKKTIACRGNQTLLSAMEESGIKAPSHCRSGECGWCHSRLISGEVFIPQSADGRRMADVKFGWIHPCCSYPLGDVSLDVPISFTSETPG
jgi:ferredoxin-NADP reductase